MEESSVMGAAMGELSVEGLLVVFMLATSVLLVAIALERLLLLVRLRIGMGSARKVVAEARSGSLEDGLDATARMNGLLKPVFREGLLRALGDVRGNAAMATKRELARLSGAMKARMWVLATAGALMPFVGLFGTVLGVMASFEAIGETGQGGFAVVSVGISQALIATAVGIAVALEGVVLFNVLQNMAGKIGREVALLADELLELVAWEKDQPAPEPAPDPEPPSRRAPPFHGGDAGATIAPALDSIIPDDPPDAEDDDASGS